MIETIVCPLWVSADKRFRSRHYHAWDRPCASCGRKVVVSDAVKQRLDSNTAIVILCEQCDAMDVSCEPAATQEREPCAVCAALKEQEESAAIEFARCKDTAAEEAAYMKWAHLSRARWNHLSKAHKDDARGRE
jgi:hypothetical protein